MKKVFDLFKKVVFSALLLYGYNLIAINFDLIVPINVINILLLVFLGAPGLLALVLFKLMIV